MPAREHGDCPYCDRPALESGACGIHEELLAGEPNAIVRELERMAELEELFGTHPRDPRRRRRPRP